MRSAWLAGFLLGSALAAQSPPAAQPAGSLRTLVLERPHKHLSRPQFVSVTLLPDRGMDVFQVVADLPGRGETQLIASPSLDQAARRMNDRDTGAFGYVSYGMGGAFLLPWASRISGEVSADKTTVTANWRGLQLRERINSGKYAVHGLLHRSVLEDVKRSKIADGECVTGVFHAGSFGGWWPSSTDLRFTVMLTGAALDIKIQARNVGTETEPMAIGWHPYFALPSGNRAHARIFIAAQKYAVTTPADGIPTGELKTTSGGPYDFLNPAGAPLPDAGMNVNFSILDRKGCVARLIDSGENYGLCVRALSPAIRTVQVYSPKDARFVAIEPQFNDSDAFGKEWGGIDTGVATLPSGGSTVWHVRLELFTPASGER